MTAIRTIRMMILSGILTTSTLMAQGFSGLTIVARGGVTDFDLTDMRSIMRSGLMTYTAAGVPARLQVDFPANAIVGVELIRPLTGFQLGLGGTYANTMSYFGFRDAAGSVRLKMTVRALAFHGSIAAEIVDGEWMSLSLGIRPGVLVGLVSIEERVAFNDLPERDLEERTNLHAESVMSDMFVGCSVRPVEGFLFGGEAGMRYAPDATLMRGDDELRAKLNLTGLYAVVWIGVEL